MGPDGAAQAGRGGVLAVVVTYQSPEQLRRCVGALLAQTRRPDVLVVDNHSDRVSEVAVAAVGAELLRLPANRGPAGGFAVGVERFLASDHGHLWLLDDDVTPDATCLERLLAALGGEAAVVAPALRDEKGRRRDTWGWTGLLVPRRVVERAGVPAAALFWGEEDAEWLHYRVRERHGFPLRRVETARAEVVMGRPAPDKPAWKYYYEVRNLVYTMLYCRRHRSLASRLKMIAHRLGQHARRLAGETTGRGRKLSHALWGMGHGLAGRVGPTLVPTVADRPVAAERSSSNRSR